MEMITSMQNARIKRWAGYHNKKERDRDGRFLIEGEHLIEEALKESHTSLDEIDAIGVTYCGDCCYGSGRLYLYL